MTTCSLADDLKLIDVTPSIPGLKEFLSVYVLKAKKLAMVDVGPAASADILISGLGELGINPADISYILCTHIHIDHIGGIGRVIKRMPGAQVVVHEKGAPHLVAPARLWEDSQRALGELAIAYGPLEPVPQDRILVAHDGMLINLDGIEIEVVGTPGHASHHLSFLDRKKGRLFLGEAAGVNFHGSIRPTAIPPFNLEQALATLDRLISLRPSTLYYAHFGYAADALEKLGYYKRQLILWGGIIAGFMGKEASWEEIYQEIRKRDSSVADIDSLPLSQKSRELEAIKGGIMGFVGYFKRYGTDLIKQYRDGS